MSNFENLFGGAIKVVTDNKKPSKYVKPVVEVTSTKGKVRIYEALSKAMGLEAGDYLTVIEGGEGALALCKGWQELDANGEAVMTERFGKEVNKMKGSKLACTSDTATGTGNILECSSASAWLQIGGNADEKTTYEVESMGAVEILGEERELFVLLPDTKKVVAKTIRATTSNEAIADRLEDMEADEDTTEDDE